MNLGRVTYEVSENIRRFGVGPAARDVAYRAANKLIPVTFLKAMAAEARDVDPEWFMAGRVLTRFATERELVRAASHAEWATLLSRGMIEACLDRGDRCVGAFSGDDLVSLAWYARTPTPISDRFTLSLDPGWIYMHHARTRADCRGRRLRAAAMSWAVHQFTEEGASGLISCVDANDPASVRAAERIGYRVVGEICMALVAGRNISYVSAGCRPYQLSLIPQTLDSER